MKFTTLIFCCLLLLHCKSETNSTADTSLDANSIVNKAISIAGGTLFNNSKITFVFRGLRYDALRRNGLFELSRHKVENDSSIFEMISNNGYKKRVNDVPIQVSDSVAQVFSASINSVHYFSVLPHGLNDKAVNRELLGEEMINDELYYKIKVTFDEDGGGEDFEDIFIYWIHKKTFKLDYMAYSYSEADGKGLRFRAAHNERYVNGLRFVDYANYKPLEASIDLTELATAFQNNRLKLLSKIELEYITVELLND